MGAKTARRLVILVVTILVVSLSIFLIQRYQVARMNRSVLARLLRQRRTASSRRRSGFIRNILRSPPTIKTRN